MTLQELCAFDGICVELYVGREVRLATLEVGKVARLVDFRPTNEDPFETAPAFPLIMDERLLSALETEGRDRLVAEAPWLLELRDDPCSS